MGIDMAADGGARGMPTSTARRDGVVAMKRLHYFAVWPAAMPALPSALAEHHLCRRRWHQIIGDNMAWWRVFKHAMSAAGI